MELALPAWFEIGSLVVLVVILVADLLLVIKRPHEPSMKEATLWVVFYVSLALIFALLMFTLGGDPQHGQEFLTGWLLEYSLSIDNLFVFVIIMARFKVPRQYQQEVLMVGIIIALILRGIFILLGAQLIASFSWIFYIFGAFLLWTAWSQAFNNHDDEGGEGRLVKWLRVRLNVSDDFDGNKIRTVINGRKVFTPMLLVFVAIGMTDVMFALDSIPAIFGVTQSPFIVFTANIFALMGLRQLYFLLGGLLDRLVYLHYGIAAILAFIGVKLIGIAMYENELPFINGGEHIEWAPHFPTWVSLSVIVLCMAVATIASLIKMRKDPSARPENVKAAARAEDAKNHPSQADGDTAQRGSVAATDEKGTRLDEGTWPSNQGDNEGDRRL